MQILGRQRRSVANRFQDTGYFINDHYPNQFRKTFPQVWSALERGVSKFEEAVCERAMKITPDQRVPIYLSLQKACLPSLHPYKEWRRAPVFVVC